MNTLAGLHNLFKAIIWASGILLILKNIFLGFIRIFLLPSGDERGPRLSSRFNPLIDPIFYRGIINGIIIINM